MHTGIAALESPSIVGRCPRRAVLEPFGRANGQLGTWCRWHGHFLSQHFFNADAIAEGLESRDNRANQLRARQISYQEIGHCLENRQSPGLETTYSGKGTVPVLFCEYPVWILDRYFRPARSLD